MRPTLTASLSASLSQPQVERVRALAAAATVADGHPPLSEQVLLHLGDPGSRHLLVPAGTAQPGAHLLGYAHLEGMTAELVVAPTARRTGVGSALVRELLSLTDHVQVWAHGDAAAARALAARHHLRRGRVLHQMRRDLTGALPAVVLPDGVVLRAFVVGRDEQEWTALNALAFAAHPEQGGWEVGEVLARERAAWFDPAGFLVAERDGRMVGSHWTKVHTEEQPPVGEVYVVGVAPTEQGTGLGTALTLAGLHHLRERGLGEVLLYVDEDNPRAVRVYERLGFRVVATDVQWVR